ncbi:uncharacterized protein YALI1_E11483g [Yarrowia lipolytica]|uniref:Uncharacterized protein n=1 Tax=Yarrowia lipolytica TaxID=4952 RepID=A0A1D8NHR0_YARLL|nr:hypothetical protein YALI1_E11483g [Yarrowia lipolytica]
MACGVRKASRSGQCTGDGHATTTYPLCPRLACGFFYNSSTPNIFFCHRQQTQKDLVQRYSVSTSTSTSESTVDGCQTLRRPIVAVTMRKTLQHGLNDLLVGTDFLAEDYTWC